MRACHNLFKRLILVSELGMEIQSYSLFFHSTYVEATHGHNKTGDFSVFDLD